MTTTVEMKRNGWLEFCPTPQPLSLFLVVLYHHVISPVPYLFLKGYFPEGISCHFSD